MRARLETRCGAFRDLDWPLKEGGDTPRIIEIPLPPAANQPILPVPDVLEGSFAEALARLETRRFVVYGHGQDAWGNRIMRYKETA